MKKIKQCIVVSLCLCVLLAPCKVYAYASADGYSFSLSDVSAFDDIVEQYYGSSSMFLVYNSSAQEFILLVCTMASGNNYSNYDFYRWNKTIGWFRYESGVTDMLKTYTLDSSGNITTVTYSTTESLDYTAYIPIASACPRHLTDQTYHTFRVSKNTGTSTVTDTFDIQFLMSANGLTNLDGSTSGGNSSASSDGVNVTVNVDTSTMESLLSEISGKITSFKTSTDSYLSAISTKITTFQTNVSTYFTTLQTAVVNGISSAATSITTSISTNFTALQTYLTGKYDTLYNVIIYGNRDGQASIQEEQMRLNDFQNNLTSVNSSISAAATSLDSAGAGVADYVTTFTQFYEGIAALNYGFSAIMLFGLAFIFVKKLIGR